MDDLVYKTSKWQRLLYQIEREDSDGLVKLEADGASKASRFPDYQRELFSRLYNPFTKKLDQPAEGSEWAQELNSIAEAMPEFRILQERCKGDGRYAGMATVALNNSVVAQMQKQPENAPDVDGIQRKIESMMDLAKKGVNIQGRIEKAKKELERAKAQAQAMANGIVPEQMRNALRKACEHAQDKIAEDQQIQDALSYGNEQGVPGYNRNGKAKTELAKKLAGNRKLRRIATMAGRMRLIAAEKQRSKVNYAREEISSIEQGADVARLLPSELGLLASKNKTLRQLFFAKLLERKALQYKLSGKETEGRGPIIMCVDESGSMSGEGDVWAKSVALAMLDIAQRQKRSWYFIHFDSRVTRVDKVEAGNVKQEELLECLEYFTGGGTSFEEPLEKALSCIREDGNFKKADIVFITDGECDTSPEWNAKFKEQLKELDVQVFTVLMYDYGEHVVKEWSNHIFKLRDMISAKGNKAHEFNDAAFSI